MQIQVKKGSAADNKLSTLVVFSAAQKGTKVSLPGFDKDLVTQLNDAYLEGVFTGSKDEA